MLGLFFFAHQGLVKEKRFLQALAFKHIEKQLRIALRLIAQGRRAVCKILHKGLLGDIFFVLLEMLYQSAVWLLIKLRIDDFHKPQSPFL